MAKKEKINPIVTDDDYDFDYEYLPESAQDEGNISYPTKSGYDPDDDFDDDFWL